MKHYCRYCIYLCVNNAPYCDAKKQFRSESSCKHPNNCKEFVFADCAPEYQDAFGETDGYNPRNPNKKLADINCPGQLSLFEKGSSE